MIEEISACMIVKNEARFCVDDDGKPEELTIIERCLNWLQLFVGPQGEIIVLDTGSTDDTKDRAAKFPRVRVVESHRFTQLTAAGEFHFAEARNESLLCARQPWLFWCDADDVMVPQDLLNWNDFRLSANAGDAPAYRFSYAMPDGTEYLRLRLFRRDAGLQFRGAAHEYLPVPPKAENIRHLRLRHRPVGHDSDKQGVWYAELLEQDAARQNRQEPRTLFYLGNQYVALKRWRQAIPQYDDYLLASDASGRPWGEERARAHLNRARAFMQLNEYDNAVAACDSATAEDPRFIETHMLRAEAYRAAKNFDAAREALEDAASMRFDPGIVLATNPALYGANAAALLTAFNEEHEPPKPRQWNGETPTAEKVSIILLVHKFDQLDRLAKCIASVRSTTQHPHEFIIVQNGIKVKPADRKQIGKARFIALRENGGFAAGMNAGAAKAAGDVLLFLNHDTTATTPFVEPMLLALDREHVGAVGPRSDHAAGVNMRTFPGQDVTANFDELLSGFCFMIRTSLFRELGGFDEAFVPIYFEDNDLCLRVQEAGYDLVCVGGAYLAHDGHDVDRAAYEANRARYAEKWPRERRQEAHQASHQNREKIRPGAV